MDPYLRPAPEVDEPSEPWPPGHVAEAAGLWNGESMEVVYDPERHSVCFVRGEVGGDIRGDLEASGWEPAATDGQSQLWVRDRADAMRQLLDSVSVPAPGRGLSL